MKKTFALLLAVIILLSLCACRKKQELNYDVYATPKDITVDSILNMTNPQMMINYKGGFRMDIRNDDLINGGQDANTWSLRYKYDDDYNVDFNQLIDYDNNGAFTHVYFTSSPNDPYMYYLNEEGAQALDMTDYELNQTMTVSMFGLEYYSCEITETGTDASGDYTATVECYTNDEDHSHVSTITMLMDPASGYVNSADVINYIGDEVIGSSSITITYASDIEIDKEPKELAPEREIPENSDTDSSSSSKTGSFTFAAHDLDGNFVTYNDFTDAKLIMVNYWEPWCDSCLDELPDLKVLYEDYKDQGFVILGVTCDTSALEDTKSVVKEYALGYPILQADSRLNDLATDYVPTTYFFDGNGNCLVSEPYIGSKTYEDWSKIVADLLFNDEEETSD